MQDSLIETWQVHCRLNRLLAESIPAEALASVPAARGRSVGAMLAHIHQARMMWLEVAAPDLAAPLTRVSKEQNTDKELLLQALAASAQGIEELLLRSLTSGKIKGFKRPPAVFLGYLIAHDAYHHGEIAMTLTQSGHPLDKSVSYGIWEWGKQ